MREIQRFLWVGEDMTDFLRSIAMTAAGIIVFASVCEMILPDNTYKKYIHLSIGLMLVLAFVTPFTKTADLDTLQIPAMSAYEEAETMEEDMFNKVTYVYTEKINAKIQSDVKKITGYDFEVKCDISFAEKNFGEPKKVYLKADSITEDINKSEITEKLSKEYGVLKDNIIIEIG